MNYWLHSCICMFLIVLQTAVIPRFFQEDQWYDLLIPFIIWLGTSRPVSEGLLVVGCAGFIQDSLSVGPFGLYCSAYMWIFICVRWGVSFLHVENRTLLPFVAAGSVALENFLFLGVIFLFMKGPKPSIQVIQAVVVQIVWAVFTAPLLFAVFEQVYKKIMRNSG